MLERLSDSDVKRTIESLKLTTDSDPQKFLTEEDYKARTTWEIDGETLVLLGSQTFGKDKDDK